ncbi:hypothetical protein GCM10027073_25200 [Streptomyces chlorus]
MPAEPWKVGDGLQRSARHEPLDAGLDPVCSRGDGFSTIAAALAHRIDPRSARTEVTGALQVIDLLSRAAGRRPPPVLTTGTGGMRGGTYGSSERELHVCCSGLGRTSSVAAGLDLLSDNKGKQSPLPSLLVRRVLTRRTF